MGLTLFWYNILMQTAQPSNCKDITYHYTITVLYIRGVVRTNARASMPREFGFDYIVQLGLLSQAHYCFPLSLNRVLYVVVMISISIIKETVCVYYRYQGVFYADTWT